LRAAVDVGIFRNAGDMVSRLLRPHLDVDAIRLVQAPGTDDLARQAAAALGRRGPSGEQGRERNQDHEVSGRSAGFAVLALLRHRALLVCHAGDGAGLAVRENWSRSMTASAASSTAWMSP